MNASMQGRKLEARASIRPIRPKVLFERVERRFPQQNVGFRVNIPSSAIGGMTLLESSVLVSLCKLFDPRRLFEFGTFLGATTLLLAENTHDDARIVTLDLGDDAGDLAADLADGALPVADDGVGLDILGCGDDNDSYLRGQYRQRGAVCIARASEQTRRKVQQLHQDSRTLDPVAQDFSRAFDYVLIDGGHDLGTVAADTANAERMIREDAVILWHDYRSAIHEDVTRFLAEYSAPGPLYHVEHTMLAFCLTGRFAHELGA
jgi:predicted O-methyltransferase YrrM